MFPSPIERLILDGLNKTSGFGFRLDPINNDFTFHKGVDYADTIGTNVYASADGEVVETGFHNLSGNYYIIKHEYKDHEYYSRGLHCDEVVVSIGDIVGSNDVVAKVGNTGYSTGSHLHIEYYYYGLCFKVCLSSILAYTKTRM
jgi:murein DD-endopeptidase MepM/ murein hydrolase activator NlpD